MKKLTDDLYLIEKGLYAERRGIEWFTSDEQSKILAGPFASLVDLQRDPLATPPETTAAVVDHDSSDLVTLREAGQHLPISHQALFAARRRGTLKVQPVIEARTTTLYSLKALKEAYPA